MPAYGLAWLSADRFGKIEPEARPVTN